ncbi:MAG: hypothetical protein WCC64_09965 [Aliidongia sp.]
MMKKEIDVFETTARQVPAMLVRLGIAAQQRVTVIVEPDDWIQKARQASRPLVVAAGLSDEDIDQLIKQAQEEVAPYLE